MIIAFKCVAMNQSYLCVLIYSYSAAAFPAQTILILCVHNSFTEVALIDVKVGAVQGNQTGQKDIFNLLRIWVLVGCFT